MTTTALTVLGYTCLPVHGHYWPDLLPLYLTFAVRIAFSFIPVTVAAFIGVSAEQAGLASGLFNTNQQIGGAIGVAVAATIFTSRAKAGHLRPQAFTSGYQWAFEALVASRSRPSRRYAGPARTSQTARLRRQGASRPVDAARRHV